MPHKQYVSNWHTSCGYGTDQLCIGDNDVFVYLYLYVGIQLIVPPQVCHAKLITETTSIDMYLLYNAFEIEHVIVTNIVFIAYSATSGSISICRQVQELMYTL